MPRISGLASAWSHTARLAAWAASSRVSAVGFAGGDEGLVEVLDGRRRRHLSRGRPAHAVGHREQGAGDEELVLVVGTDQADVGRRSRPQLDHRRTSMVVLPIWSLSPLRMAATVVTLRWLR